MIIMHICYYQCVQITGVIYHASQSHTSYFISLQWENFQKNSIKIKLFFRSGIILLSIDKLMIHLKNIIDTLTKKKNNSIFTIKRSYNNDIIAHKYFLSLIF